MIYIEGKEGISARVIADSINEPGNRMITLELEYPRFILAEVNTHRMLSKNSASSRAIPVGTMHQQISEKPARPVFYGKNQSGMVAKEELCEHTINDTKLIWDAARDASISHAAALSGFGNHKQVVNRLTEPFQMTKTVMSGTEWDNLLWLRNHPDAQPEFQELARCIAACLKTSVPAELRTGQWHLPYVDTVTEFDGVQTYWIDGKEITLEQARRVSVSCCAQVSYRKNDDSLEKADRIFEMLNLNSKVNPPHFSPAEHQACAMWIDPIPIELKRLPMGYTHVDRHGNLWSGNLKGWIQYRKMIEQMT